MADPSPTERSRIRFPSRSEAVTGGIGWVQEAIYIAVGVLLAAAGILVIIGTVDGVIKGIDANDDAVLIGLQVLDRVLLRGDGARLGSMARDRDGREPRGAALRDRDG